MNNSTKTVLITGANSGIGLEAAALFAEDGYGTIILATRSLEKGEKARVELTERVGKDVFDIVAVDLAEADSARGAAQALSAKGHKLDVLVLNAAMSNGEKPAFNSDGVEMTFASTLLGHHVLTMCLLEQNNLAPEARIVIAGSEGARGDFPGMNLPDFHGMASKYFNGNLEALHEAIWKIQTPYTYQGMSTYVTGKVYVAWWAAELASRLPEGMTVNAVSPGSVPDTNFARHQGWFMRNLMMPIMKLMPKSMGMASTVEDGARRYLDAVSFGPEVTGKFFGSPPGKFTGKLEAQTTPHLLDKAHQQASWKMLSRLSHVSLN